MPRHSNVNARHVDSKICRRLEDQRRMQFRQVIEDHREELCLRQELANYPELIAAVYLSSNRQGRRSAQRVG